MTEIREIITSDRTEGMINASALNYQESKIFHAIQNSQALEYDRVDAINTDLALQLSPFTATWGLVYWEASVGIAPQPLGAYAERRPAILARLANEENFGAAMIYRLAENFGEKIHVEIDTVQSLISITFQNGTPKLLRGFTQELENIIHAHLAYLISCRFPCTVKNDNRFLFHRLRFSFSVAAHGLDIVKLDGGRILDGSWWLNQRRPSGFKLDCLAVKLSQENPNTRTVSIAVQLSKEWYKIHSAIAYGYRVAVVTKNVQKFHRLDLAVTQQHTYNSVVTLTSDTMWCLDGGIVLDGRRRLNAKIQKDEV